MGMSRLRSLVTQLLVAVIAVTALVAAPVHAADTASCGGDQFLTFKSWWNGLPQDAKCRVQIPANNLKIVWTIALNLIDDVLQIVAYAAVGYIIWGGIKYMKSVGDPSAIGSAKSTIMNAIIGLGIALSSIAIIRFVFASIQGSDANNSSEFSSLPGVSAGTGQIAFILDKGIFPLAGVLAVIFIIIGGFQYMTSNGDAGTARRGRETIIYAVVGLVVVLMAFGIVQLVLGNFG